MREITFLADGLHLSALQGISEAHSEAYMQYGNQALQLITQQSLKTLGGLDAPQASRTRGCMSS